MPSDSGIPGDPSTGKNGNDSFFVSGDANSLAIQGSNTVRSFNGIGAVTADEVHWFMVTGGFDPESGVIALDNRSAPLYSLAAGTDTFSIGGGEVGFIADTFVLSRDNLNLFELEVVRVLLGSPPPVPSRTLRVLGDLMLAPGTAVELDLGLEQESISVSGDALLAGELTLLFDAPFSSVSDSEIVLLDIGGNRSGLFDNWSEGKLAYSGNGYAYRFTYFGGDGNDVALSLTAVPEADTRTAILLLLGAGGLAACRRRMRRAG